MKKMILGIVILSCFLLSNNALAAEKKDDLSADQKKAELRKKIEAKKLELNGTKWEVNLVTSDPKAKLKKDTLTFQNNRIVSKNNSERGFTPTNYTISIPSLENETAIWETMQTSSQGDIIFMRGEWQKDAMVGVITEQFDGGKKTSEYSFTTAAKSVVSPSSEVAQEHDAGVIEEDKYEPLVSKETFKKNTESGKEEAVKTATSTKKSLVS